MDYFHLLYLLIRQSLYVGKITRLDGEKFQLNLRLATQIHTGNAEEKGGIHFQKLANKNVIKLKNTLDFLIFHNIMDSLSRIFVKNMKDPLEFQPM